MLIAFSRLYVSTLNLSGTCLSVPAALHSWMNTDRVLPTDRVLGRLAAGWVIIVRMVEMGLSTRVAIL